MAKGFEPWIAVKVGVRKNRKLAGLPDDTARYGWIAGVLAEAKLQRPGGRFDSRGQLEEAIGRFAGHVDDYLAAGLLEVAGRLCTSCRKVWVGLPSGSMVVHDWRSHQRDPFSAARAEAWRSEHENDDGTTDERMSNDDGTTGERATNTVDSRDVTADSRAHGERAGRHAHETPDSDSDKETGDSPQPPRQAGGRSSRANGTSPRQKAEAARTVAGIASGAKAWNANQRKLAYHRGAITEDQRREMDARDAPLEEIPDWAQRLATIEAEQAAVERPGWAGAKEPAEVAS